VFWFDVAGVVWIIAGMVFGYRSRFSQQVRGVVGCILGLYLAAYETDYVVQVLKLSGFLSPAVMHNVVFFAIALISSLVFSIVGAWLSRYLRSSPVMELLDHGTGLVVGLLVSSAIMSTFILFLSTLSYEFVSHILHQSAIACRVLALAPAIYGRLRSILIF